MRQRGSIKMIGLVGLVLGALTTTTGGTAAHAALPEGGALPTRVSTVAPPADESDTVGSWTVTSIDGDTYELTWTSPAPLPLTDARPEFFAGGQPLGPPALSGDGRTLTLQVSSPTEPRPVDLDVVLSGRALDEAAPPASAPDVPYVAPAGVEPLPGDPGVPGSHEIESDDYSLAATKIAGMPDRVEMLGHVVQPTDADDTSPLVMFLHGRHSFCYKPETPVAATSAVPEPGDWSCGRRQSPIPSHLGYDYVQRRLATQGYVTVSISANAINAQDFLLSDGGAAARASLVKRHLNQWATWAGDGTYNVDLDNVILVGHSRGGEGVNRASIAISLAAPYRVTGQVLIGPTDFGIQTAPYVPTVTLLPYCDGDVSDLQGQTFTDAARDMTTDDTALHSSALVMGANHNFFNTEWTPGISAAPSFDDWFGDKSKTCGTASDTRLSKAGQRKVGRTYIAGAVHLFADGDTEVLPMFDGSAVSVASADNADVRTHTIGGGRELRRPGVDSTVAPSGDAATRLCIGRANDRDAPRVCDPGTNSGRTPHWPASYLTGAPTRRAFEMMWSSPGQQGGLRFGEPLDLSGATSLDLRTIVDPDLGGVRLDLRLYDADGDVSVTPEALGRLRALPGGGYSLAKRWAQTLRVPLEGLAGIDLTAVTGFDLVGETEDGRVWVLDAAAVPASGLPPAQVKRLPALSVRSVTQDEGDGPGAAVIQVPYSITTPTTTESHVVAVSYNAFTGEVRKQRVTIPAGTSAGAFDIAYRPDTRDDYDRQVFETRVFSVDGVTTNRYIANATVRDDDPPPTVTLKALPTRIIEGEVARWKVSISKPVDYFFGVRAQPVEGQSGARSLTVGDLTPKCRTRVFFPVPPLDRPLTNTRLMLYVSIEPGDRSTLIDLPTLADRRSEGRRSVTLRFRSGDLPQFDRLVTVIVRDPS